MGVGGHRLAQGALPPGTTRYPIYRRLGGQQGRSGRVRKISSPLGFDHRTLSLSLSLALSLSLSLYIYIYIYIYFFPIFSANGCSLLSNSRLYVRCAVYNSPKSNEFTTLALQNTTGNSCTTSHVQQHCTCTI